MERLKSFIANPVFTALSTFVFSLIVTLILRFGLGYNKVNLEHIIIPVAIICFFIYVKTFKTGSKGMPKDFKFKYCVLTTLLFLGFKICESYYLIHYSSMLNLHLFIRKALTQAAIGGFSLYFIAGRFVKPEHKNTKNVINE